AEPRLLRPNTRDEHPHLRDGALQHTDRIVVSCHSPTRVAPQRRPGVQALALRGCGRANPRRDPVERPWPFAREWLARTPEGTLVGSHRRLARLRPGVNPEGTP